MNGNYILLLAISILSLSCESIVIFEKGKAYICQGEHDMKYFELNLIYEKDSIFSFINDSQEGVFPGMKNSYMDFKTSGRLIRGKNSPKLIMQGSEFSKLEIHGSQYAIVVDTIIENPANYFTSSLYISDFYSRMQKFSLDTTSIIEVEIY